MEDYQRLRQYELKVQRAVLAQKKAAAAEDRAEKRAFALVNGPVALTGAKKAKWLKGLK